MVGVVASFIVWYSKRSGGEPFTLTEGISAWPSIILSAVALGYAVTALIRVFSGHQDETHFAHELYKDALGNTPPVASPTTEPLYECKIIDAPKPPAIKQLMSEFLQKFATSLQLQRVGVLSVMYGVFSALVWALTPHDLFGIRDLALQWASWTITKIA